MRTPTFPHINTLTRRALMRLLSGQQFIHRDFQNETATYLLSEFISQLRKRQNWPIETIDETAPTNDPTGRAAAYGWYLIERDVLKELRTELGERLDRFIEAVKRFESRGMMSDPIKKAAAYATRAASQYQKIQSYCKSLIVCLKAKFIRLAVRLSIARG